MAAKKRGLSVECAESGESGCLPVKIEHAERASGDIGVEMGGPGGDAEANAHFSAWCWRIVCKSQA